jgi:hypothetical protein
MEYKKTDDYGTKNIGKTTTLAAEALEKTLEDDPLEGAAIRRPS